MEQIRLFLTHKKYMRNSKLNRIIKNAEYLMQIFDGDGKLFWVLKYGQWIFQNKHKYNSKNKSDLKSYFTSDLQHFPIKKNKECWWKLFFYLDILRKIRNINRNHDLGCFYISFLEISFFFEFQKEKS